MTILDHLVWAVPDLESAMDRVRAEWGCEVLPGGRHPRWGSWNAVVPIAGEAYVEIIAPHPEPPESTHRIFGLDSVRWPTLVTWAVRPGGGPSAKASQGPGGGGVPALEKLAQRAGETGVEMGALLAGSRRTPEGRLLEWTLSDPSRPRLGGVIPFLIGWGETPHPSGIRPAEVSLLSLELAHPDVGKVEAALAALQTAVDVRITPSPRPGLRARLATPRGAIELATVQGPAGPS